MKKFIIFLTIFSTQISQCMLRQRLFPKMPAISALRLQTTNQRPETIIPKERIKCLENELKRYKEDNQNLKFEHIEKEVRHKQPTQKKQINDNAPYVAYLLYFSPYLICTCVAFKFTIDLFDCIREVKQQSRERKKNNRS